LSLPDLVGRTPEDAELTLKKKYPKLHYHFVSYIAPISKNEMDTKDIIWLITRQRTVGDNVQEFTISPFYRMSD
jgi:hypothetical protein